MPPSQLLRALYPLRSSIVPTPAASLQCSRPALLFRRSVSSSTPASASQPQQTQQPSTTPSAVPSSLRNYPYTLKKGTVVSVGRMDRTVRVDCRHTIWDDNLRKFYTQVTTFMVSDPRNSLREGDVIEFSSGYPKSRRVHHVVERIIAPFGEAIENRPPVMSREERDALRAEKRAAKLARREQKRKESGAAPSQSQVHDQEHIGRVRRLVLERTVA
ncbi:hypothetical protein BJX61DRAFT_513903 [Aspergillus egyptiacus]|nr:hypothetical protein BJX61DRAFT_513903 [Aspergillus egyptiacus]